MPVYLERQLLTKDWQSCFFLCEAIILDKLLLYAISREQGGTKEYVCKGREICVPVCPGLFWNCCKWVEYCNLPVIER